MESGWRSRRRVPKDAWLKLKLLARLEYRKLSGHRLPTTLTLLDL